MKIYEYEMLETEMTEGNRNYGGGDRDDRGRQEC